MTWVDLAVLGVMALSGLLAWMRGFVREILSIAAWIGALFVAARLQSTGKDIVSQWIHDPQIAAAASFVGLVILSLIILKILAKAISAGIKASALGGIDRTLGLVFGLGRGAFVAVVVYILGGMATSIDHWPPAAREARCLPLLYEGSVQVQKYLLPEEYRPRIYAPPSAQNPSADALLRATPLGRAIQASPLAPK